MRSRGDGGCGMTQDESGRRKYWRSMVLGLVLLALGVVIWGSLGPVPLPALPGVRVPVAPFLCLAGAVLTVVSVLLWRAEGAGPDD